MKLPVGGDQQSLSGSVFRATALGPDRRLSWKVAVPLKNGGYSMKVGWEILQELQNGATQIIQQYHYELQHKIAKNFGNDRDANGAAQGGRCHPGAAEGSIVGK